MTGDELMWLFIGLFTGGPIGILLFVLVIESDTEC